MSNILSALKSAALAAKAKIAAIIPSMSQAACFAAGIGAGYLAHPLIKLALDAARLLLKI